MFTKKSKKELYGYAKTGVGLSLSTAVVAGVGSKPEFSQGMANLAQGYSLGGTVLGGKMALDSLKMFGKKKKY